MNAQLVESNPSDAQATFRVEKDWRDDFPAAADNGMDYDHWIWVFLKGFAVTYFDILIYIIFFVISLTAPVKMINLMKSEIME